MINYLTKYENSGTNDLKCSKTKDLKVKYFKSLGTKQTKTLIRDSQIRFMLFMPEGYDPSHIIQTNLPNNSCNCWLNLQHVEGGRYLIDKEQHMPFPSAYGRRTVFKQPLTLIFSVL